ncbi:hypothetical protein U0070_006728, partial [Myodes glareolus]
MRHKMKKMKWHQLQGKNKHRKIQASCFFGPLGRIIWLRDRGYRLRILLLRVKMSIALFVEQMCEEEKRRGAFLLQHGAPTSTQTGGLLASLCPGAGNRNTLQPLLMNLKSNLEERPSVSPGAQTSAATSLEVWEPCKLFLSVFTV